MKAVKPDLISQYGSILEITSSVSCTSSTFLPANKDELRLLLLMEINSAKDEFDKLALKSGYVHLAKFVSLDEAVIVFRFEQEGKDFFQKNPEKKMWYPDDNFRKRYHEIQKRVAAETEKLSKDIENL